MAKNTGIAAQAERDITPVVSELGYDVWDVEYVKEGSEMYLRITIDKPDGITIDDCETVHRAIDPVLDEVDPIEDAYHLEVSSPGIERELRTDAHFAAFAGKEIEVRLYAPSDGAKVWTGDLLGLDADGSVRLSVNGSEKRFPRASVAAARTVFRFENAD